MRHLLLPGCLALAAGLAGCSSTPGPAATGPVQLEGTITAIDTRPWTYDGHAVVQVDVPGRGTVAVQLPARWHLCRARPVDVAALAVGMHVTAAGEAEADGAVTVCADPAHHLTPH